MKRKLDRKFFERGTLDVARDLIEAFLVRRFPDGRTVRYLITEVEAYDGPLDKASHASKGRTPRTETMFGKAGTFYVYLVYGMHHMLNVVTGPVGYPAAVLIRAVEGITGPGRLAQALGIDRRFDTGRAAYKSGLWFEASNEAIGKHDIRKTPRIGVSYAGEEWAAKKYRFVLVRRR